MTGKFCCSPRAVTADLYAPYHIRSSTFAYAEISLVTAVFAPHYVFSIRQRQLLVA